MPQTTSTTSGLPTVSEPTPLARAEAIWRLFRELDSVEKLMEGDLAPQTAVVNAAKVAHDQAKETLRDALVRHPSLATVKRLQEELAAAKAQFANSHKPLDPKTVKTASGDKVQVRGGSVVVITDHEAVARTLLEKDLWKAAGATISANQEMLTTLAKNGVLADAVSLEDKFSVALIADPKKVVA